MQFGWVGSTSAMALIAVRQQKTNTPLLIPIHPDLEQALAAVPRTNLTFLMTSAWQAIHCWRLWQLGSGPL